MFGVSVYNDKLQIKFMFCSGPMIFCRVMALGLWNLAKYLGVTTFFLLCLKILTWYLVYGCIMISYRSSSRFVLVQWFLAELWPLDFEILPNDLLSPLFVSMLWDINLIFGIWVYNDDLQIKFTFCSCPMIFGRIMAFGLWNLAKYLVVTTLFHYDLRSWLDFWYESV